MERRGDWMQTHSGLRFYPLDPRPEDIRIEDIAHALPMICRFNGHCSRFYSVAEHSLNVAAFAFATSGVGERVGFVEDDHAVIILADPIDDLLKP